MKLCHNGLDIGHFCIGVKLPKDLESKVLLRMLIIWRILIYIGVSLFFRSCYPFSLLFVQPLFICTFASRKFSFYLFDLLLKLFRKILLSWDNFFCKMVLCHKIFLKNTDNFALILQDFHGYLGLEIYCLSRWYELLLLKLGLDFLGPFLQILLVLIHFLTQHFAMVLILFIYTFLVFADLLFHKSFNFLINFLNLDLKFLLIVASMSTGGKLTLICIHDNTRMLRTLSYLLFRFILFFRLGIIIGFFLVFHKASLCLIQWIQACQ